MTVDGGAGDPEFLGDLGRRVFPFAFPVKLVIHLPGKADLARPEFGFLSPGAAPSTGCGRPVAGRSDIRACSDSAIAPMIWKNIRPIAVEVSIP